MMIGQVGGCAPTFQLKHGHHADRQQVGPGVPAGSQEGRGRGFCPGTPADLHGDERQNSSKRRGGLH